MPPVSPGEMLDEECLKPLCLSKYRLAKDIGVPPQRIGDIVAGKHTFTADTILRPAPAHCPTSAAPTRTALMIARTHQSPRHDVRPPCQAMPRPTRRRFALAHDADRVSFHPDALSTPGALSAILLRPTDYPSRKLFGIIIRH